MPVSPWQRRIQRAQELVGQHPFAAEMLGFYIPLARFQEDLQQRLSAALSRESLFPKRSTRLRQDELENLTSRFEAFLSVAETHGPKPLAELSRELRSRGSDFYSELLQNALAALLSSDA